MSIEQATEDLYQYPVTWRLLTVGGGSQRQRGGGHHLTRLLDLVKCGHQRSEPATDRSCHGSGHGSGVDTRRAPPAMQVTRLTGGQVDDSWSDVTVRWWVRDEVSYRPNYTKRLH